MVAVAFIAALLVVLGQIRFLGEFVPHWIFRVGTFGIAVIFLLRAVGEFKLVGFFKTLTGTPFAFWDTWLYSPLCLAIAVIAFVIAYKDQ